MEISYIVYLFQKKVFVKINGGQGEIRTRDLYNANVAIFQLIYLPDNSRRYNVSIKGLLRSVWFTGLKVPVKGGLIPVHFTRNLCRIFSGNAGKAQVPFRQVYCFD